MEQKTITDQEIIRACRKGQVRYQELLYRRFYAFAISISLRYSPNREDALETLNDSFMKVFQNIGSYDDSRPFKSWFRKIIVNTALNKFQENRKYMIHSEPDAIDIEVSVEPQLDQKLNAEEILNLMGSLPALYRLVFNLYEIEGYTHQEIAGMLDMAPGTSRSYLTRARQMLRTLYSEMKNKPYHEAI